MFEIYISDSKTYTNFDLKTDLEELLQTELTERIFTDYVEYRIRNTIDIGLSEIKCLPYKEIRVRKKYMYTTNFSSVLLDSNKIERIQNLVNDILVKANKKIANINNKYKNFRVEDMYLYIPLEEFESYMDITIYVTFVFNPLIYTNMTYYANSNDLKIEKFNNQIENLKIDIEDDSTADNVQISTYNHPFAIAYDVLLTAFPGEKFIAIPKIKNGNYKIVKLDNYNECKIFDILGIHQIEDYTGPIGNNYLKDVNQSITMLHNYILADIITNDFQTVFIAHNEFNKFLSNLKPITYKVANEISLTPTGNFIREKNNEKEDAFKNNEVDILTRAPFGLSKLFRDMALNIFNYRIEYTPAFQKDSISEDYNTLLDIAADTYYINAYNRYFLFPIYTKWTHDFVFIGEVLQKKIDNQLEYNVNNNRQGILPKSLTDTKNTFTNIIQKLSNLFKF